MRIGLIVLLSLGVVGGFGSGFARLAHRGGCHGGNYERWSSYRDGEGFIFMDTQNYDQMSISPEVVGDAADYMLENVEAIVAVHEGNPLYIELPASVELLITYTEPGLQGDRSSGGTKPATVETGIQIQVPLFIKQDEKVLVDTRTGAYLGRANS